VVWRLSHSVADRPPPPPKSIAERGAIPLDIFCRKLIGNTLPDIFCIKTKGITFTIVRIWLTFGEKCAVVVGMIEDCVKIGIVGGPCGVYALVRGGMVVYVGQSLNVFARISTHNNNMRRLLKGKRTYGQGLWRDVQVVFDEVWIWRCEERDLDREELAKIQAYRPEQNQRMNRPIKPVEEKIRHLPCIQALIKRAGEREPSIARRRIIG
jgi:hypothetical protein